MKQEVKIFYSGLDSEEFIKKIKIPLRDFGLTLSGSERSFGGITLFYENEKKSLNGKTVFCIMPDGSEKWLKCRNGFRFIRGIQNKDKVMGLAEDENGKEYIIKVASCNLPTCYCAAQAIENTLGSL